VGFEKFFAEGLDDGIGVLDFLVAAGEGDEDIAIRSGDGDGGRDIALAGMDLEIARLDEIAELGFGGFKGAFEDFEFGGVDFDLGGELEDCAGGIGNGGIFGGGFGGLFGSEPGEVEFGFALGRWGRWINHGGHRGHGDR